MTRKTRRTPPVSFYLGDVEQRKKRLECLEAIAKQHHITRSVLLQKIADGELIVTVPATDQP